MIGVLLADMLKTMRHEVCAIETTGAGAVAAAARCNPDLMIVDVRLEDGASGVAAVDQILLTGFIPHFFISGNLAKVRALRPDAMTLEKPFAAADLERAIQLAMVVAPARADLSIP